MLRSQDHVFQIMPIFYTNHMNMSFHGNQIEDIVAILLQKRSIGIPNGTKWNVYGGFKYDHQILHKKLV